MRIQNRSSAVLLRGLARTPWPVSPPRQQQAGDPEERPESRGATLHIAHATTYGGLRCRWRERKRENLRTARPERKRRGAASCGTWTVAL